MLPDGPIKTFTLRGIKDSPPYLHDGRLLTLADCVEFFNLVLGPEAYRRREAEPGRLSTGTISGGRPRCRG